MRDYTYAEVGATRSGTLPAGYHHVRRRHRIGVGRAAFEAAAEGVMTWQVLLGSGLSVDAAAPRAHVGVNVTTGLGVGPFRLRIPCRIVWTVDDADQVGFGYGTLPGHPEHGEEAFLVEIDGTEDVWFTITAFSRPATWYTRLAGPLARLGQAAVTSRYVSAARRLAAAS